MKNEVFKSVVQVKVELNSNLLSANVPQELLIISPHPLSDTTLLLFSHDKLISALKQDESLSTIYKFLSEDNDSIIMQCKRVSYGNFFGKAKIQEIAKIYNKPLNKE